MPSLADLANNLPNYQYYSGYGTFSANKLPADKGQAIVRKPGQEWSMGVPDTLTPFGTVTTVNRTLADLERIGKFLYNTAQGPMFLAKQVGLHFSNVELEHPGETPKVRPVNDQQGIFTSAVNSLQNLSNKIRTDFGPTRVYNLLGTSTLAEVGVVASGIRFTDHGGIVPEISNPNAYENYILEKAGGDGTGNRLYQLSKNLSNPNSNESKGNYIAKYKGGPDSIYGIGSTTIKRDYKSILNSSADSKGKYASFNGGIPIQNLLSINDSNTGKINPYLTLQQLTTVNSFGSRAPSYLTQAQFNAGTGNTFTFGEKNDFRIYKNKIPDTNGSTILATSDYTKYNLETRIGIGRARTKDESDKNPNYWDSGSLSSDKLNLISLFYGQSSILGSLKDIKDVNGNSVNSIRDMIKFRIKSYDNDNANDSGVYMVFRAYLTNIKRNMQSKWNPYTYVGRGENFYLYDGFSETITFSFTVIASSRAEMKPMYQKLNYLMSTLTPDYNKQNRMRGNISELTIGDYVKYQPGVITNLDMVIDDDANWEIAIDEPETGHDADMHELPHMIKCNMTFLPIYNFLPRKSAEVPFIGIDNTEKGGEDKEWLQGNDAKLTGQAKKESAPKTDVASAKTK
jgi:hypothetical protein